MPEQEQGVAGGDPNEESAADTEATPALNREQRRAQAKGKKSGGTGINPALPNTQNVRGPGTRSGTPGAASRFQRKTGSSGK